MTTMIVEVYDALIAAGAPEDKAKAAAKALAADRLATKQDITMIGADIAVLKAELTIVKWMVGGIGFGVLLLVLKAFLF